MFVLVYRDWVPDAYMVNAGGAGVGGGAPLVGVFQRAL